MSELEFFFNKDKGYIMGEKEVDLSTAKKGTDGSKVPLFPSCRVTLCIVCFIGGIARSFLIGNINIGMVCMVIQPTNEDQNSTGGNRTFHSIYEKPMPWYSDRYSNAHFLKRYRFQNEFENCPNQIEEDDITGIFDWSRDQQGLILSAQSYGSIIITFLGGYLSDRYSPKLIIGSGTASLVVLTLLSPIAAELNVYAFFVIQFLKGMTSALFWSPLYVMWAHWAPPLERTKLVNFMYSGVSLGAVFQTLASGYLCEYVGWESLFYVYGVGAAAWLVCWYFLAYDTPAKHPRISKTEREYIENGTKRSAVSNKDEPVPWKQIFLSKPVWACIVADFCYLWSVSTSIKSLPQYMADVLQLDIAANGLYNSVPYLFNWVTTIVSAIISDWLITKKLRLITIRKTMQTIGLVLALPCVFIIGYLDCFDVAIAVSLLTIWFGFLGFCRNGSLINPLDFGARYIGIIKGIASTMGMIPGMISPSLTAALVPNGTQAEWRVIFFICGGINLFGAVVYLLFAETETQEWAKTKADETSKEPNALSDKTPTKENGILHKGVVNDDLVENGVINEGYISDQPISGNFQTKF